MIWWVSTPKTDIVSLTQETDDADLEGLSFTHQKVTHQLQMSFTYPRLY